MEDGHEFDVTKPVLQDIGPAFDPDGKYLYFLSRREFDPVYDNLHFDLGFPKGMRPYLVTLRKDLPSPFLIEAEAARGGERAEGGEEERTERRGTTKPQAVSRSTWTASRTAWSRSRCRKESTSRSSGIKGKALFTSVHRKAA